MEAKYTFFRDSETKIIPKENRKIAISFCSFQDDTFEFYLVDKQTGKEILFEGKTSSISEDKLEILEEIAPACVYTTYGKLD